MRMRGRILGLTCCLACLSACGGEGRSGPPPQSPQGASETKAASGAEKSSAQPSYAAPPAPASEAPSDYANAPPAAAPSPAPPAAAESTGRAEAPTTTDARARYARANVQLSEARRQLDIATGQRDCANACRALDSMERAAAQVCELARSSEERRTCKSVEDQVGAARDRVHNACGDCPKKAK